MSSNFRVGLMGGSFDPIHLGHIAIAQAAWQALNLDRVLFLPSGRPPHKAKLGATAYQRLQMTRLAVEDLPWAEALDVEVFREGTIYTVDTLGILKQQYPQAELWYIIGADTLLDLPNWRNTEKVCTLCRFVCVHRPGVMEKAVQDGMERMRRQYQTEITLLSAQGPDLSSTEIRERLRSGETLSEYLPKEVEDYIRAEKLYQL